MKEFKLKSRCDDVDLSVALTEPEGEPVGIIQVVHGMVEHKARYYGFMKWMSSQGFVCVAHDHRGHGASIRSLDELGYMHKGGWRAMVDDVKMVNEWVKEQYPGLPVTLLGHSMGSMVVRSYAKRHDDSIDALIVCGCPSYNPMSGVGVVLSRLIWFFRGAFHRSKLLLNMSIGSFRKAFPGSKSAWISSDTLVQDNIDADPLCGFTFTANGYNNLLRLMRDCYSTTSFTGRKTWVLRNPSLPVLFISGAEDPCRVSDSALESAVDTMRQAGYTNVSLKTYPGMRHHIIIEKDKEKVWNDIKSFAITK